MEEVIVPVVGAVALFIAFPWILFHYITKWKQAKTLTGADERLLEELHEMARRLDDRLCSIERIMSAENPNWRQSCLPESGTSLSDDLASARLRRGERL